ncbi:cation:proton antiporter regulatory subunit [Halolamina rubra]|uniref:cation:proton antiporter regulatory subunit n=1 Tax=Halolamina rubra TaxID=1380430 RepID=UPI0012ABE6D6|nr:TrkA C-terminal domain-containing protein [Halolamina rubra]
MILQMLLGEVELLPALGQLFGLSVLAFLVSGTAALAYRWYFREPIPRGLAALFGVAAVALYLNTVGLLGRVIGTPGTDPFDAAGVGVDLLTLLVAFVATVPGRRLGDALRTDLASATGAREVNASVGRALRGVARLSAVELPAADAIEDMQSHDPVPAEVKAELGGKTLLFPRSNPETLRERLVTRLKEDYGVGYVDAELAADGTVTYLALGSRLAGIGPTLGPGTCAIAVEADPASDAGPGDIVQVWTTPNATATTEGDAEEAPSSPRRVTTAELRATAGESVTLVVDETDAAALSPDERYRLVTLPVSARADQEFASLLRSVDETLGVVQVPAGSPLVGTTVGDLESAVVAVRRGTGAIDALPDRERVLESGDSVYAIGRPDVLRGLEERANSR